MAKSRVRSRRGSAPRKRKNILIDQGKLAAAKAALGARTETETIDSALDLSIAG